MYGYHGKASFIPVTAKLLILALVFHIFADQIDLKELSPTHRLIFSFRFFQLKCLLLLYWLLFLARWTKQQDPWEDVREECRRRFEKAASECKKTWLKVPFCVLNPDIDQGCANCLYCRIQSTRCVKKVAKVNYLHLCPDTKRWLHGMFKKKLKM
ncbi:unnamed protein product [Calicophoron daubneyi]|uniref:Uncharacterized protein n=1 Tax=Calicophoron daubneyi TaxID=300641 RepID=A0AAV2TDZ9_CALDB